MRQNFDLRKDVNECSNIRIQFEYSNTISEFEYLHFYLSPRCASSKFSKEESLKSFQNTS